MKSLLFTLFVASILFAACGDDDSSKPLVYDVCGEAHTFSDEEKTIIKIYNTDEIPANIRSYVATEFSGFAIRTVTSIEVANGSQFIEVIADNDGKLLFDTEGVFLCGDDSFLQDSYGGGDDDD